MGGGKYNTNANADLLSSLGAYHEIKQTITEAAKMGCMFDGYLKINAYAADNDKAQKTRDAFLNDIRNNKGGVPVLDNGADYVALSRQLKMVDAATLKEIKDNVLINTGVSLEMLEGKYTTQQKEAFYEMHIEPAAISLGQAMSKVFFSQWQTSHGDQIILYPHKVQLMATSEIVSIIQSTISAGVFKIDEYREMLGYAPLDNDEGEQRPRGFNNLDGQNDTGGGATQ
jgi:HK97 family phage portal protein